MIASWMIYSVLIAGLLSGAALAGDAALRLTGREARWIWVAALLASLGWPLAAGLIGPAGPVPNPGGVAVVAQVVAAALPAPSPGLVALDTVLLVGWGTASGAVLLLLVLSQRALRRDAARGLVRELDGHRVCITAASGPAVVGGLRRAAIVLPAWMVDLDPSVRSLAVRHEAEHLRTGDVRVLAVTVLAAVACPWNPFIWWQLGRLRDAMELDCDRRLLRAGVDVRTYGSLLLEVARRHQGRRLAVALAGRPTLLSRRIDHMTPRSSSTGGVRAVSAAALGALLIALACETPTPAGDTQAVATAPQAALADRPPQLISIPAPVYPPLLRQAGIEGDVVLEFMVDAAGQVDSASVVVVPGPEPAHRALERSAAVAIRTAVYRPAVIDGAPRAMRVRQAVSFRLPAATGEDSTR
jgi:TonB family protein